MIQVMQSRLLPRFSFIAIFVFLGILSLRFGALSAQSAEPTLANVHTVNTSGSSITLEVSQNEYAYVSRDGEREHRTVAQQASAEAMRQFALNVQRTSGGRTWLVMYPPGQPRNTITRRFVTEDLLVKLDDDADVNGLTRAFGLTYRGGLSYYPGMHVYRGGGAGHTLQLLSAIAAQPGVLSVEPVFARSFYKTFYVPNDPLFTNQWHLLNTGQNGALIGSDVNITNAWERYRGSNVVIGVFDSGMDTGHPDLRDNVLTNMAFNPVGDDQDVSVRPGEFHGTAVAGVAAARGDNNEGLAGSAPEASIVPIRFAFGDPAMTTLEIADGLLHSNDVIQVHNNSWGITTAGFKYILDSAESNAFQMANQFGRGGLGTIFVFSSGNDGDIGDDVNYSGYTKEMTTISVNALNDLGQRASYSTYGAAAVISAPAGLDATRFQGTSTTDVQGTNGYNPTFAAPIGEYTNLNYTAGFNGTSSAAPLASGVIALMLNANTNLGWRDVQEILIRSASLTDTNHFDWITNAAGFHFNHEYGAGIVNADAAVTMSETWTNLSLRTNISVAATSLAGTVTDTTPFTHTFNFTDTEFRIEHVQLRVNIAHPLRGDLSISVTSPAGTQSILSRAHSDFNPNYTDYTFMTVRNWGEIAAGDWSVQVNDLRPGANGIVNDLELILWGSISNAVFSSLTNPPSILQHPLSRTATKGSDVFFRVNATGSGALNYRWLFNGNEISGQNNPTLIVNDVTAFQQGTYAVRIDNQFGNTVSAGASLFVNSPPEITAQPANSTASLGGSATFNVAAIGNSPISYQWRHNGNIITNATFSSLTVSNLQSTQGGTYDVVVRNPLSSIISQPVLLNINSPIMFSGLTPAAFTGSSFGFSMSGATGQTVRVDTTTNFITWTILSTNVLNGGNGSFNDSSAGTFTNRYYRVVPLD